ncbi:hypothetical protein V1511DRAFT_491134 [Dipodascopsis uninucleata]
MRHTRYKSESSIKSLVLNPLGLRLKRYLVGDSNADELCCAICLASLDIYSTILTMPCKHKWHRECISEWLEISAYEVCPLCKSEVGSLQLELTGQVINIQYMRSSKLNKDLDREHRRRSAQLSRNQSQPRYRQAVFRNSNTDEKYRKIVLRRRYVYQRRLRCCYVGSNELSKYRNFGCAKFRSSRAMQKKAKAFIRRDLSVFPSLCTSMSLNRHLSLSSSSTSRTIEFLIEYLVNLLSFIDMKSIRGAEFLNKVVSEHLGADNGSIFLHELYNFLRSPFLSVEDYDKHVRYIIESNDAENISRLIGISQPLSSLSDEHIQNYMRDKGRFINMN